MIQNLWKRKLKLNYSSDVLDIVQFGSSITEEDNPNDIDIAVIFNKIPLKEQLGQAQEIKRQLERETKVPIHITSYDFYSLFDKSNFAREGLLFYGISLVSGKPLAERFDLKPRVQISYKLNSLEKKDKIRFNYLLNGKGGKYGLLRELGGSLISPGLIEINPEHEKLFIEAIGEITKDFAIKKVFYSN
ncbi:MAG: hypothetical protein AABW79_03590 [Nanoarchaeota archaeon]